MKIIILSDFHPKDKLGGGGAIAYEFHQELLQLGHESAFWHTGNENYWLQYERGFRSSDLQNKFGNYLRQLVGGLSSLKIARAIVREQPEIVWVNQIGNRVSYIILLFLRLGKVSTFVTLHDYLTICRTKVGLVNSQETNLMRKPNLLIGFRLHEKVRRFFLVRFVNLAGGSVAVSEIQREVLSSYGVRINSSLPNGVAICKHDDIRTGDCLEDPSVLFAGRFHRKGLEYLVAGIQNSSANWILHLAGDPDLLEFASSVLQSEQIEYHGRLSRNQLHLLMHSIDLVGVISQYFDPYPTVGLESVRHGSMFITTNTSGISELLDSSQLDFLLRVGETPNLDYLLSVLKSSKNLQESINNKIPNQEAVIQHYLNLMNKVVFHKNSGGSNSK